ncbi:MAG: hypothetical protein QT04_C0050G0029 [archaeon GW2011_AR11]|nr:MAG: hypothetical protein QT04_C0050G0029 [archaeon GW2011_AR11]
MTEQLFKNTRLVNVFDKANGIKNLIKEHLPEIKEDKLIYMMSHCRQYYEGKLYYGRRTSDPDERKKRKIKALTKIESELFQLLLKYKINPSTAYRWLLAVRIPEDIMDSVRRKGMNISKAMEIARNRKYVKDNKLGWQMISMIREIVRWL